MLLSSEEDVRRAYEKYAKENACIESKESKACMGRQIKRGTHKKVKQKTKAYRGCKER